MRNEKQILNSQLSILNLIMEEITLNNGGSLYLSECSVGGTEVKDKNTEDGWYHYGKQVEFNL